jgi:hypothetical protein
MVDNSGTEPVIAPDVGQDFDQDVGELTMQALRSASNWSYRLVHWLFSDRPHG